MYLSKILLDIRHPSVRQTLRDANDMHRNLMAGFDMRSDTDAARAENHVLFRLYSRRDQMYLLVASDVKPDIPSLSARGFHTDEALIKDVTPLKQAFIPGRCFRFELLASPCKKVVGDGKNSRRYFLDTPEARAEWLRRKGEQGGFEIVQVDEIGDREDICGYRRGTKIKNSGVVFTGLLRISDPEAFWQSYSAGIGPGKAYGMGMLTLARA